MTTLLQHGITGQAEAAPDAVAIVYKGARTSYRELEIESNRIAHSLVEMGCRPGDRVAILMPKLPAAIAGMLGVLKAQCAYVPLDPADPAERLARTLEVAGCRAILAAGPVGPKLRRMLAAARLPITPAIGWLDHEAAADLDTSIEFTRSDLRAMPSAPVQGQARGDSIAHILFTSGSTGTPKGVMVSHANVLHFIRWATAYFGIRSSDRISQHPSLRFDGSTFDIFGALWAGAELHLVPAELNLVPHRLADLIRNQQLTQWLSVPSVLNLMAKFDVIRQGDFPDLRRVMFIGEVLPTPTLMYWMRRLPHVRFTNLYGPTETTVASSYYTVPRRPDSEDEHIPIGKACDGEELLLLDEKMRPITEPGVEGDLYILGRGVTAGYWREPGKTRDAFLPAGPDGRGTMYRTGDRAHKDAYGLFHFNGRADTQIKCRGYRIELGEIEAALHSIGELRESVVVAIESGGFEGTLICCAYATDAQDDMTLTQLRKRLAEKLPAYMIPVRWSTYDLLPKNTSGKFDRPLIREHFEIAEAADRSTAARVDKQPAMSG